MTCSLDVTHWHCEQNQARILLMGNHCKSDEHSSDTATSGQVAESVRVEPEMEAPPEVIWEWEDAAGTLGRVVWNDGDPLPQILLSGLWHGCDWPDIDIRRLVFDQHQRIIGLLASK